MPTVFQVLGPQDIEEVQTFADEALRKRYSDEQERVFASWTSPMRKESLEHYLKTGWCFIARDEQTGKTTGVFLAQPFLFVRGQTQTLWVEHIEAVNEEAAQALADVVVRVGREKHMQRVIFHQPGKSAYNLLSRIPHEFIESQDMAIVKTTKG